MCIKPVRHSSLSRTVRRAVFNRNRRSEPFASFSFQVYYIVDGGAMRVEIDLVNDADQSDWLKYDESY